MAVWGVQIALYPIYVAFQSSRLAAKQLRHSIGQTLPRLQAARQRATESPGTAEQPLTSDTPIRKVLAEVQAMGISLPADQIQLQPALAGGSSESLQSISNGKTPKGKTLSLRVRGLACAIDSRKLVLATVQNQILDGLTQSQQEQLQRHMVLELADYWRQQRILALRNAPLVDRFLPFPYAPNAFLPIRLFYQLMAWEQRGTIASATNLFQETRLRGLLAANQPEPKLKSAEVKWLPVEEWSQAFSAAVQQSGQRSSRWFESRTQAWLDRLNRLDNPSVWEVTDTSAIERVTKGNLATWSRTPTAVQTFQPKPKSIVVNPTVVREVVPFTPPETALATVTPESNAIAPNNTAPNNIVPNSPDPAGAIEVASYIEADVQLVGYVKHPLEQLLEWLDRGMFWIEDRIAKFWNWIRGR